MKRKKVPAHKATKPTAALKSGSAPIKRPPVNAPAKPPRGIPPSVGMGGDLVVAIYEGFAPPYGQLPSDLREWKSFEDELVATGMNEASVAMVRSGCERGMGVAIGLHNGRGSLRARTVYAVLQNGRAVDDIQRAMLVVSRVAGTA